MAELPAWLESLGKVFADLRNKEEEGRERAAAVLSQSVAHWSRDLNGESLNRFIAALNDRILELVNSSAPSDKLSAISVVGTPPLLSLSPLLPMSLSHAHAADHLMGVEFEENVNKLSHFAQQLRIALVCNDPAVVTAASRVLGRLAKIGGVQIADSVETDVKRALDGLRSADRRLAAVLVLKELALNARVLFYQNVPAFIPLIPQALQDKNPVVRAEAHDALDACLTLCESRDINTKGDWYNTLYLTADEAVRSGSPDCVHGALLCYSALLRHARDFVRPRYGDMYRNTFQYRDHKDKFLAKFDPRAFAMNNLNACMTHLLQLLKPNVEQRGPAFTAIGEIATALGQEFAPYVEPLVAAIKAALPAKTTAKQGPCPEALTCVAMLAFAVNNPATVAHVQAILPLMFGTGLSAALVVTLRDLCKALPSLMPQLVQPKLFEMISGVLLAKSTASIPQPAAGQRGRASQAAASSSQAAAAEQDPQTTVLALHTLSTFNFTQIEQLDFVHECVVHFLDDENSQIRQEAAVACAVLILKPGETVPIRGHASYVISEVLQKLLIIRRTVLEMMDPRFDHHLAQAENLRSLFTALNDEVFEIRELAITVIGRLMIRNPAYVMPSLRKTLIQLLNELEYSGDNRVKEESAMLLGHLIRSSKRLIKPYVEPILCALLPKLRSASTRVASCVLSALGDLAVVGGEELAPHTADLLPFIIETLHDQSSMAKRVAKREIALRTLGQLIRSTGAIDKAVREYPELLDLVVGELATERSGSIRTELLKVLGILGAVDPYKHKLALSMPKPPLDPSAAASAAAAAAAGTGTGTGGPPGAAGAAAAAAGDGAAGVSAGGKRDVGGSMVGGVAGPTGAGTMSLGPDVGVVGAGGGIVGVAGPLGGGVVVDGTLALPAVSSSSEEYNPTIVIAALLRMLRDTNLSVHHKMAVMNLMQSLRGLGLKSIPFLAHIMPTLFHVIRACEPGFREFMFQQLGVLVSIVKQHIRDYLDRIFQLMREYWSTVPFVFIIGLAEQISLAINDEFKVYLPTLIPLMLKELQSDRSPKRINSQKIVKALETFGTNLDDYLHLVIPAAVSLIEQEDTPAPVAIFTIHTLGRLCRKLNFSDFASRIVHPLARVLERTPPQQDVRDEIMRTLCTLARNLGPDYAIFIPMISKVLVRQRIQNSEYEILVSRLLKNQPFSQVDDLLLSTTASSASLASASSLLLPDDAAGAGGQQQQQQQQLPGDDPNAAGRKLTLNLANLRQAWEATTQRVTKEDWVEWLRQFSTAFLRESPSPALRSCQALAHDYPPLVRELFNAAFLSCWNELGETSQDQLTRSLSAALASPTIPHEILQCLLNLAEYMEHEEKQLPIEELGWLAQRCHAYAKALHYREQEFQANPSNTHVIEELISINNQLQQPEAAVGILLYAQQRHNVVLQETWYEKLGRWEDANSVYELKQKDDPTSLKLRVGRMRCLHALGEWEQLDNLAHEVWPRADDASRAEIAPLAAAAAWNLAQWQRLSEYTCALGEASVLGGFYRAVLALHNGRFCEAKEYIEGTRGLIDPELTALVSESYDRAYSSVVQMQQLAELEEVIEYKCSGDSPERQATIRAIWERRLRNSKYDIDTWQSILRVHTLVLGPHDDLESWTKFAGLCAKSGRFNLAFKTLSGLVDVDEATDMARNLGRIAHEHPKVAFAYIKSAWASAQDAGAQREALAMLLKYRESIAALGEEHAKLKARACLRLGQWQLVLAQQQSQGDTFNESAIPQIIQSFRQATEYGPALYKVWHAWALINFEVVSHYERQGIASECIVPYITTAIHGFFKSISSSANETTIQDTLRLLTLLFKHGQQKEVESALMEGFATVSIDTWLQVIPQIIARIDSPVQAIRRLTHELLTNVGKFHPQALVYPLTVASKRTLVLPGGLEQQQSATRLSAAQEIIGKMRKHYAQLIDQALLVSRELIRVAILWHEMWYEGLEEASRLYYAEHNVEGMLATLAPLHAMMEQGPETLREASFQQVYGRDLQEALDWCRKYQRTGAEADINAAWALYYQVFKRIHRQLPQMTTLELQYVSPKLLAAKDLDLAVPGTYRSASSGPTATAVGASSSAAAAAAAGVVKIKSVHPTLAVITSKQRPRRLTVLGSNGVEYKFLLKGHEDLRQDERVMQLFGLINNLLASRSETSKTQLAISCYAVIPLSPNSGLIGWVPHCDTLHQLIREYRDMRQILLNIEHRLMLQMAPVYDILTLMQKVEVFEYALDTTDGLDLERVLWLKSANSETWLQRRTNYTRSVAVMSMVGYILGLGDRHPSNLMLDRYSGQVVHIDFGDCFEVAMHRDKYPERIPFRLTRMLVNAMEVSGIEGNFRFTCEKVMRLLRENKDSLMAVLEAFVYDPLINWRLLTPNSPDANAAKKGTSAAQQQQRPEADAQQQTEAEDDGTESDDATASAAAVVANQEQQQQGGAPPRARAVTYTAEANEANGKSEVLNARALTVIKRVSRKLTGRDFGNYVLDVPAQVDKLIKQATSHENLCQCYIGWCPFW
eukprot:m51a1_g10765 putative protein atypical group (2524) ;mRNA; r:20614-29506